MTAMTFVHNHYSSDAGESAAGHALAVVGGLVLAIVGVGLMYTVALLPVGVTVALLGLLIICAGAIGHISSPLSWSELLETIVSLAAMAIGMTFTLAVVTCVAGFVITVLVLLFGVIK